MEGYTAGIRFDSSGNLYVAGATDSGTGARFSYVYSLYFSLKSLIFYSGTQPFVAKIKRTNGKILFNTRASRSVHNPPDPYSYAGGIALDDEEGRVYPKEPYQCIGSNNDLRQRYLTGGFGCTLKFGNTSFKSVSQACAAADTPPGRNTFMYLVSMDAATGEAC